MTDEEKMSINSLSFKEKFVSFLFWKENINLRIKQEFDFVVAPYHIFRAKCPLGPVNPSWLIHHHCHMN